ncbi:MAG: hypothetical protein ACFFAT_06145 [Promethearchaeota archaeon]
MEKQKFNNTNFTLYNISNDPLSFFNKLELNVQLENHKEIILQEETLLELGGVNRESFLLIFPTKEESLVNNGRITLIGPEIKDIKGNSVDFGLFILLGCKKITEEDFDNLRQFSFISNSIEGFMIRTIPRRFWCRINSNILPKFSFEFLGNAIQYLYKQQFKDLVQDVEIIMLCSKPDLIDNFKELTSELYNYINSKWSKKIEIWKKRIDCEYDWNCEDCPYIETCDKIRDVLEERKKMEDD